MIRYFISIFILLFVMTSAGSAQTVSFKDSTIVFKNQEGKVITRGEAEELMKEKFSIKQENEDGKKVITIIPDATDARALFRAQLEAFRQSLIGKPMKSFKFTDLYGNKWNSKDLKEKVVVMNFWFTSCQPCIKEMPLLNKTVADYKDNDVVFIAPAPEKEEQVNKFLLRNDFKYNIIPSSIDFIDKMKIEVFPTHLIIDKQGIIREVFIGYSDDIGDKLQEEIRKLL